MQKSIATMKNRLAAILQPNTPSIYLFGSVTLDDFKLGWSDIDILCLTQTPLTNGQAQQLLTLRQTLLKEHCGNPYFRLFEGGILPLESLVSQTPATAVYWGTSGQRITDAYILDPFSTMELLDSGIHLYGQDVRSAIPYPTRDEIFSAVHSHYETIRKYAITTNPTLYSIGWLLDIARCLYTLDTGKIISKTAAGEWALAQGLVPDVAAMQRALVVRKNPMQYKEDAATLAWAGTLGDTVQRFADVLAQRLQPGAQGL